MNTEEEEEEETFLTGHVLHLEQLVFFCGPVDDWRICPSTD